MHFSYLLPGFALLSSLTQAESIHDRRHYGRAGLAEECSIFTNHKGSPHGIARCQPCFRCLDMYGVGMICMPDQEETEWARTYYGSGACTPGWHWRDVERDQKRPELPEEKAGSSGMDQSQQDEEEYMDEEESV